MHLDLSGRVAVVFGEESPLGMTFARTLAADGANIAPPERAAPTAVDALVILVPPIAAGDLESVVVAHADALAMRKGRVLIVSSAMGVIAVRGHASASAEAAAALSMAHSLAINLAPRGICVNALALGAIGSDPSGMVSHTALRRKGTLDEAAAAAMFLLDPQNTYMTGQTLAVDGGWTAGYTRDF